MPDLVAFAEHVDHDLRGVERGRAADGTSASVAAVLAARRVTTLLDDLDFLVVRAHVYWRVRQIHQARLLVLSREAGAIGCARSAGVLGVLGKACALVHVIVLRLRQALAHALPDPLVIGVFRRILYLVAVDHFGLCRLLNAGGLAVGSDHADTLGLRLSRLADKVAVAHLLLKVHMLLLYLEWLVRE